MEPAIIFLIGVFVGAGVMLGPFLSAIMRGLEHRGAANAYRAERDGWMVQSVENARKLAELAKRHGYEVVEEDAPIEWPEELEESK